MGINGWMERREQEKHRKVRMEMRQNIRSLKQLNNSIEKKKTEMIALAKKAKEQGLDSQYKLAFNALKMMMSQQLRVRKMSLQIEILESLREMNFANAKFVKLFGNVGREATKLVSKMNMSKNQMDFQAGFDAMNDCMGELEGFMEENDMMVDSMDMGSEASVDIDNELMKLINGTGEVSSSPKTAEAPQGASSNIEDEIEKRYAALRGE